MYVDVKSVTPVLFVPQTTMLVSALEVMCEDDGRDAACQCDRAAGSVCSLLLRLVSSSRLFAKQLEDSRGLDAIQVCVQCSTL